MKTKHIFSLLLACLLCAMLLVGCGTPASTTGDDTTALPTEPDETTVPESTETDVEVILSDPDGTRLTLNSFLSRLGITVPDSIVWTADFDEKDNVTGFTGRFTEKTDKAYRFHTYQLESISDMTSLLHQTPENVANMFGKNVIPFSFDSVDGHVDFLTALAEKIGVHGSFFASLKETTDKNAENPASRTFNFIFETPYEQVKGSVDVPYADTEDGLVSAIQNGDLMQHDIKTKTYGKLSFSKDKLERCDDISVNP